MVKLKVSTSNFFVGNMHPFADALFLAEFDCDISGVQEGHSGNGFAINKALKGSHKIYWGSKKNRLGDLDVVVVAKKNLDIVKSYVKQISKRSQKKNIGMDRSARVVVFKKNGKKFKFINTHTNAVVQNRKTHQPLPARIARVGAFIKGMIVLEAMIVHGRMSGCIVIVVGDLNYRIVKQGAWRYSPQALFKRQGMDWYNVGLDYIAFSKKHLKLIATIIIGEDKTHADHPWLIAELVSK